MTGTGCLPRRPFRFVSLVFLAFTFLSDLGPAKPAHAQEREAITVSLPKDYLPLSGLNLAGEPSGLLVDIWRLWEARTGVDVQFLMSEDFEASISAVRTGVADMQGGLFRNSEREAQFHFSRTLGETVSSFYTWVDRKPVETMEALVGQRIGVVQGTSQEGFLRQHDLQFEVIPYLGPEQMLRGLARGELDAVYHEDLSMQNLLAQFGGQGEVERKEFSRLHNGIHGAVPTENETLRELMDWGFTQITAGDIAALERRWIQDPGARFFNRPGIALPFNEAELTWLGSAKRIRLGIMADWPPFSDVDGRGSPRGMTAEIVDLLNLRLDGRIELVPGPWADLLEDVRNGTLDGILDITASRTRVRDYHFTSPYLVVPHGLVARRGADAPQSFADLAGRRVALERGFGTVTYIRTQHPGIHIAEYEDTTAALDAVAAGQADAWAGNTAVFEHIKITGGDRFADLEMTALLGDRNSTLQIGVRRDAPVLRDILEKTILGLGADQVAIITEPWVKGTVGNAVKLDPVELHWLAEHRDTPVRIGVVDWPPFTTAAEADADDGMVGLSASFLQYALDRLGMEHDIFPVTLPDAMKQIGQTRSLDMLPGFAALENPPSGISVSKPYAEFPIVIITRTEHPLVGGLSDLGQSVLAVEAGFPLETRIRRDYPSIQLQAFPDTHAAIAAVSLGKADAYVGNLASSAYHIDQHGFTNLKVASPSEYGNERISFAVRDDWAPFVTILDKVVSEMPEEDASRLRSEALLVRFEDGALLRQIMIYGGGALVVVTLVLGVILYVNRRLSREVERRRVAERAADDQQHTLRKILDNVQHAIALYDRDLKLVVWNSLYPKIVGVPDALLSPGKPLFDLVLDVARRGYYGAGEPHELARQRVNDLATRNGRSDVCFDGNQIFDSQHYLIEDGDLVLSYTDITARKKSEQALRDAYGVISDSIAYASRIQRGILPTTDQISTDLADHYVIWEPRDVVGGDVYWCRPWGTGLLIALGDCTGHGVPGAFMTLIASGAMDQAMKDVTPGRPGQLLFRMHQIIRTTLGGGDASGAPGDGMEIGVCFADSDLGQLRFAGARFSLFHRRRDGIREIKGKKTGIGYPDIGMNRLNFPETIVSIDPADSFHMVSDGVIDQIGGTKRRAFGKRRLEATIVDAGYETPMRSVGEMLLHAFQDFQGTERRRDDVAAIGFRIGSGL